MRCIIRLQHRCLAWKSCNLIPGKALSRAYDMVLNGVELGGGSIRIHKTDMQKTVFGLLGIDDTEAQQKFGFLLTALKYGCPLLTEE